MSYIQYITFTQHVVIPFLERILLLKSFILPLCRYFSPGTPSKFSTNKQRQTISFAFVSICVHLPQFIFVYIWPFNVFIIQFSFPLLFTLQETRIKCIFMILTMRILNSLQFVANAVIKFEENAKDVFIRETCKQSTMYYKYSYTYTR